MEVTKAQVGKSVRSLLQIHRLRVYVVSTLGETEEAQLVWKWLYFIERKCEQYIL